MAVQLHVGLTPQAGRRLWYALILFELGLVLVFMMDVLFGAPATIHLLFDLGAEATIPAWFSAVQLCAIGILFLLARPGPKEQSGVSAGFLMFLGAVFVLCSMDEVAGIHEKVTGILRHVPWMPRFKGDRGMWIPVYLALLGASILIACRKIRALYRSFPAEAILFALGFVVALVGAVGVEVLSYRLLNGDQESALYQTIVAGEEFLEMAGTSTMLYGVLLFASRDAGSPSRKAL